MGPEARFQNKPCWVALWSRSSLPQVEYALVSTRGRISFEASHYGSVGQILAVLGEASGQAGIVPRCSVFDPRNDYWYCRTTVNVPV